MTESAQWADSVKMSGTGSAGMTHQAIGQTSERQLRALARADPGGSLSSLGLDPVSWSPGLWCHVAMMVGGNGVRLFVVGGPGVRLLRREDGKSELSTY